MPAGQIARGQLNQSIDFRLFRPKISQGGQGVVTFAEQFQDFELPSSVGNIGDFFFDKSRIVRGQISENLGTEQGIRRVFAVQLVPQQSEDTGQRRAAVLWSAHDRLQRWIGRRFGQPRQNEVY